MNMRLRALVIVSAVVLSLIEAHNCWITVISLVLLLVFLYTQGVMRRKL